MGDMQSIFRITNSRTVQVPYWSDANPSWSLWFLKRKLIDGRLKRINFCTKWLTQILFINKRLCILDSFSLMAMDVHCLLFGTVGYMAAADSFNRFQHSKSLQLIKKKAYKVIVHHVSPSSCPDRCFTRRFEGNCNFLPSHLMAQSMIHICHDAWSARLNARYSQPIHHPEK